jgi:fibronectin type 3 domain-containing protein
MSGSRTPGSSGLLLLLSFFGMIALLIGNLSTPALAQGSGLALQNFDATGRPDGWSVVNTPSDGPGWSFNNPGGRANETGGAGNMAIADSDQAGLGVAMDTQLRTPTFSLSGLNNPRLQFRTFFKSCGSSTADVDISTNNGASWTNVWRTTNGVNGLVTVDLSPFANQANVILRFRYYNATWAWYWQLDDIRVSEITAPAAPSGLSATVNASEVALSWQAVSAAAGYTVQRSDDSVNFTNLTALTDRSTSYTDSSVNCNTNYTYRVVATNVAGNAPSNPVAANTAACAQTSLTEAFTTVAPTPPPGWSVENNGRADGWTFNAGGRAGELGIVGDNFAIADNLNGVSETMDSELRSPPLNLNGQAAVKLSFRTFFFNLGDALADLDVSSDGGTSWTNVWRATSSINNVPLRTISLDLSATAGNRSNVILRFRLHNSTGTGLWIVDDVALTAEGAPAAPTNLSASLDASGAVKLTWNGTAPGYLVERAPRNSTSFTQIAEVSNQATTLTDVTVAANTNYDYRVRARNGAGTSAPSNIAQITSGNRVVRTINMSLSYYDTAANAIARREAIQNNLRYFADAIYEMSNGANRLGRVEIYTNGAFADRADIVWVANCWPNAHIAGYGTPGLRIEHCDQFGNTSFIGDDSGQRSGGYTLGHEMGHYFYSLYDEYSGNSAVGQWLGAPISGDTAVERSVMNSQWRAVEGDLAGDFDWLNFSTALNNTNNTAQHRVYGASAWETLARPLSADPRDGQRSTVPQRLYHPELIAAAPLPNNTPNTELKNNPAARNNAREALQFAWVGAAAVGPNILQQTDSDFVRQFVVDVSANTSPSQLAAIQAVLKTQVERAAFGDVISLISYADTATVVLSPTVIIDASSRFTIQNALDNLRSDFYFEPQPGTGTAMGEALQLAIAAEIPDGVTRAVYLFSAAVHTGSVHPASLIGAYQAQAVAIYGFDLGFDEALTSELLNLAEATEGEYFSAADLIDLQLAVSSANQLASPQVSIDITSGSGSASSSTSFSQTLTLDATIGTLNLDLLYQGSVEDALISLIQPDGTPAQVSFERFSVGDDLSNLNGQYTLASAQVVAPAPGAWKLIVESSFEALDIVFWASGEAKVGTTTFSARIDSLGGEQVQYPDPILIVASISKAFPITKVGIRGVVTAPDGSSSAVTLRDDGVAPDHLAGDGYYSAIIDYRGDGEYLVEVFFDNNQGNAELTEEAVAPSPDPDGNAREAQRTPVAGNFERYASLSILVSGSQDDDHADDIDGATLIRVDNSGVNGRIDFADDFDVFQLDVPADYSGALILRVARLALGMDPYVYAFAADDSWELEQFLEIEPTSDSFLSVSLPPSAGKTVYIVVAHLDEEASQGLYELSVGPGLTSEAVLGTSCLPKPTDKLYLPLIRR